jgi:hypothetical protein
MIMEMYVQCKECGEQHQSEEVESIDIREDFEGRDVITFICPVTGKPTESLVFIKR